MKEKIIETEEYLKHNQYRCPNCSSTEIIFDKDTKKLKCSYCKTIFEEYKFEDVSIDISTLEGKNIYQGAKDIKDSDIITITCNSCGAEVVIDSKEAPIARCHWCHSILSLDNKIENGAVPDVILPFSVDKEEAMKLMSNFISKKSFYAKDDFLNIFKEQNVKGVYLPYMIVDTNAHCTFEGTGEHETDSYEVVVGHDKDGHAKKETRYDADLLSVSREFDIEIDDLTIESSSDKINKFSLDKTNYIINSIMPFDTENCIKFKANYLVKKKKKKRDMNILDLEQKVQTEINDICRLSINKDLKYYDRGIKWDKEEIVDVGKKWVSAVLPVWIFSYCDKRKKREVTHYVVVNGRTKELSGSIPINIKKLFFISGLIDLLLLAISIIVNLLFPSILSKQLYLLLLVGIAYFLIEYFTYNNKSVRHYYESETKYRIYNIKRNDELIKRKHGLSNYYMYGANNKRRDGE